jgi:hypothetical protein
MIQNKTILANLSGQLPFLGLSLTATGKDRAGLLLAQEIYS